VDIADLRNALQQIAMTTSPGIAPFTDPTLVPGVTPVRVQHITEPRSGVPLLE
jgi:hypothetical protein